MLRQKQSNSGEKNITVCTVRCVCVYCEVCVFCSPWKHTLNGDDGLQYWSRIAWVHLIENSLLFTMLSDDVGKIKIQLRWMTQVRSESRIQHSHRQKRWKLELQVWACSVRRSVDKPSGSFVISHFMFVRVFFWSIWRAQHLHSVMFVGVCQVSLERLPAWISCSCKQHIALTRSWQLPMLSSCVGGNSKTDYSTLFCCWGFRQGLLCVCVCVSSEWRGQLTNSTARCRSRGHKSAQSWLTAESGGDVGQWDKEAFYYLFIWCSNSTMEALRSSDPPQRKMMVLINK